MNDLQTICDLIGEADRHHVGILPDVFQLNPGPARPGEVIAEFAEGEQATVLLAESESKAVGCLMIRKACRPSHPIYRPHDFAMIDTLVVREDSRGRGIGAHLLQAAKDWVLSQNLMFIQTNVWTANEGARRFYSREGFRTFNERIELDLRESRT
jgi:GNAT superfamily N-acetyltransferase